MALPYRSKTGIYQLRRKVPPELREALSHEYKRSLKTRDPAQAKALFADEWARSEAAFALARARAKGADTLGERGMQQLAARWFRAELQQLEVSGDFAQWLVEGKLLRRDRHTCACCGGVFPERDLQCEHVLPESRGGPWTWMNLVAACALCNNRKAARTPEEAGMPLVYLPYVPSRFESFPLEGRNIRADVHEWLARRLPKGCRLH